MGWFSGMCSLVGSVVGGACRALGSLAGAIGTGLATLGVALAGLGSSLLPLMGVILAVGQVLGIFRKEDKVEDIENLGYQMTQCDKKPEDFESTQAYIDHVRANIQKPNAEDKIKWSDVDRLKFNALGAGVSLKAIEEVKGVSLSPAGWAILATHIVEAGGKENTIYNAKVLEGVLDNFKGADMDKLTQHLDGKLESTQDRLLISDKLNDMYQALNPDMSTKEVFEEVIKLEKPVKLGKLDG
ncbi:hypothetical protein NHP200010_04260 [Helicobacter bizzozeronii]|uniref:hypothetical protein n=1 Tax=Helicobacter bizzozeronii TaxID=56877 RepID=UPI00244D8E62|nr:hypothetical protein [Helicobacter bizzozeronii]GMB92715.1 hypothetical protein NHP200010_04260 [Helicobacter bizzozeronii]